MNALDLARMAADAGITFAFHQDSRLILQGIWHIAEEKHGIQIYLDDVCDPDDDATHILDAMQEIVRIRRGLISERHTAPG